MIVAVAGPVVAAVFFWHQNNFETPMPKAVLDAVTTNPLVFPVFIVLAVASFAVQYFFGSPERRSEIRFRAPILIFISPVVVLILSALAWWQSGSSFTTIVSEVAQKPYVLGSVTGLTFLSLILAFVVSTREEQKRCLRVLVTLTSVFLMFGGPTYLIYGLQNVMPYSYAALIGLASFLIGIAVFLRFVVKGTEA